MRERTSHLRAVASFVLRTAVALTMVVGAVVLVRLHFAVDAQRVNVRYAPAASAADRLSIEKEFGLIAGVEQEPGTWSYLFRTRSRSNIQALVLNPLVQDTHHIDRSKFRVVLARPDLPAMMRVLAETGWLPWLSGVLALWAGAILRRDLALVLRATWRRLRDDLISVAAASTAVATQPRDLPTVTVQRGYWPIGLAPAAKGAMYLIIALYFCAPILTEPLATGQSDWDQNLFFAGQVLKNVIEYGSAPFWSPWYCGGNVMWQNPQVALLSPVFPLATLVPLTLAMKLNIVLHYWIGFIGMHLLITRAIGLSFLPLVIFLATLFTASGAIVFHLQEGHSTFLVIMYLPIMLMWLLKALQFGRARDTLLAGGLLALTIWNGGVQLLPGILLPIGILVVIAAVMARRWHPLLLGACFLVAGLAYAAPKLLPVGLFVTGERFADNRSFPDRPDAVPVQQLPHIYLDSDRGPWNKIESLPWEWHEYGNYVGTFPAVMLMAGLVGALWYRRTADRWLGLGLAAATLFLFSLSLGEFADWAPVSLAGWVPGLSRFRVPSRYTLFVILFATVTLAWTLRSAHVETRLGSGKVKVAVALICMLSSIHMIEVNRVNWERAFHGAPLDTHFQWGRSPSLPATDVTSSDRSMLRNLFQDRLAFNCYEPLQLRRTARPDRPLVFADHNTSLQVTRFQPNRIDFDVVNGGEPARIYLNTNWSPGWHTNAGTFTVPDDTPPFVTLDASQRGAFSFWFVPEGLWPGVVVLAAAILISIGAWRIRI